MKVKVTRKEITTVFEMAATCLRAGMTLPEEITLEAIPIEEKREDKEDMGLEAPGGYAREMKRMYVEGFEAGKRSQQTINTAIEKVGHTFPGASCEICHPSPTHT